MRQQRPAISVRQSGREPARSSIGVRGRTPEASGFVGETLKAYRLLRVFFANQNVSVYQYFEQSYLFFLCALKLEGRGLQPLVVLFCLIRPWMLIKI